MTGAESRPGMSPRAASRQGAPPGWATPAPGCESRYRPIGDYALIGDCHTAALIARDGSVDWFCPDRFDAPAVFCRLLDAQQGGYLEVAPVGGVPFARQYVDDTNVLQTVLRAPGGRVRLTDLMPAHARQPAPDERRGYDVGRSRHLLRLVEALDGDVEVEVRFRPTFDFARQAARVDVVAGRGAVARPAGGGGPWLALGCRGLALEPLPDGTLRGRLPLRSGERRWVALHDGPDEAVVIAGAERPLDADPEEYEAQLTTTLAFWRSRAARCTYRGPYRPEVVRSALTLKLLTYEPSGAIVAAPTTSLPEEIGGERNWDYRFTWLRDAALILYALQTVGYHDEAADFFEWLNMAAGEDPTPRPQIMYGIDGRRNLAESALGHLEGYACSRPVRVGNAAAKQRQLDIYGEVLSAAYVHYRGQQRLADPALRRRPDAPGRPSPAPATWALLRVFVELAADHWREPDQGIWEVRGGPQQFLYSKLLCWVAVDRGLKLAAEHQLPAPAALWGRARENIRQAILAEGYHPERGAFTQAFGSTALDASALVIPRIGFLPPADPRVQSTVERIREELTHDGLVYRYRAPDGLAGGEATFTLCTYWLVNALALEGRLDEAHDLFERTTAYANDVGLLSEEIDPHTGRLLGNHPQGFAHLALIESAVDLAKAAKHGAEHEPEDEGQRADRAELAATEGHFARPRGSLRP